MASTFESLCGNVTKEVLKNVNHLARDTRNIIKEQSLNKIPELINKKNFTLTSDSHLAALFIKIIQYYVNITFANSNNPEQTKTNKLSKYIWQIQKGKFKESTKKKISGKFKYQRSKFFDLIDEPKKFENILIKAKTLTKNIKLDDNISEELETKQKAIDDIINEAKATGYTQDLSTDARATLSNILTKIKNTSTEKKTPTDLHDALNTILSKPEHGSVVSCQWDNISNEVASLKYVNEHYNDTNFDTEFREKLKHCHAGTISQLLKAKERIVNAYKRIGENNAAKKTRQQSSSLSSELKTPNDLTNNQLPPKPSCSPPPVPTDDIPDYPPPLGSVTPNNTPTATTEQKTPSTLPRPGRPAPKSSDFYNQREKLKTANGEHTPPADPPPKPPRRVNSNATSTATTEQKITKTHKKKKQGHTPPTYQPPPAPKGKSGTATTPLEQHKRNLRAQRKNRLPLATPPKLEVPTGGPPQ